VFGRDGVRNREDLGLAITTKDGTGWRVGKIPTPSYGSIIGVGKRGQAVTARPHRHHDPAVAFNDNVLAMPGEFGSRGTSATTTRSATTALRQRSSRRPLRRAAHPTGDIPLPQPVHT
jgi:hypothetical protein